ncbi:MAG: EAL domain-containing protein [Burkholderiales bacterium]|nr:EAL domain-containing protein [Burkholderiales bacterium]
MTERRPPKVLRGSPHKVKRRPTRPAGRPSDPTQALLGALTDAVIAVDALGDIVYLNPTAQQWFGVDDEPAGVVHTDRPAGQAPATPLVARSAIPALAHCFEPGSTAATILTLVLEHCRSSRRAVPASEPFSLSCPIGSTSATGPERRRMRLVASPAGPDLTVLVFGDVTDSVRHTERLLHEARHDSLTGLPNRVLLGERLDELLRRGERVALLFIDLDRFCRINEALGQRHGDAVLHAVAARLVEACPRGTSVGRWGGDEFVVLIDEQTPAHAVRALAELMLSAVARCQVVDDLEMQCTCSVGIASTLADSAEPEVLVAAAESAMRRAKALGGARCEWPAASRPAWTRDLLVLEERLRQAIGTGGFVLHYQPQIDMVSGKPVGLEALVRWRQANGELWSPGRFLAVAEESGAILGIGAWVLREAASQMMSWLAMGLPALPVSVNVSARQCRDRHLVDLVGQVLADTGLPPELLKLEVTETTAMADVEQVRVLLGELRALGVGVSVDDFGTGYSSFAHLTRLPIDQIKIDQSFVHDVEDGPNGAAIVRATIKLAHELGVPVVAEGVESAGQMKFLAAQKCDIAQGYFCSHPLAADAAEHWMRAAAQA